MLSIKYAESGKQAHFAECHYAECRYAECRGTLITGQISVTAVKKFYS
jgi:hypothetical protein